MKTRHLAIMLTDIKGFTSRTAASSRSETLDMLKKHRGLVLPVIEKHSGRVVKTIGDAFLVVFESPTDAVICGVEIQDVLKTHNHEKGHDDRIDIRIAINSGEVSIEDDGDIYGDAVNITSRLESIAEVGEVFFTEAVYLAMNKKEVPSSEIGYRQFKGIPEKIKVYRVLRETPVGAQPPGPAASPIVEEQGTVSHVPVAAGFWRRLSAILIDVVVFFMLLGALGLNSGPGIKWSRSEKIDNKTIKNISIGSDGVSLERNINDESRENPDDAAMGTVVIGPKGVSITQRDGKTVTLSKTDGDKVSLLAGSAVKGKTDPPIRSGVYVKGDNGESVYISKTQNILTAALVHPKSRSNTNIRKTRTDTKTFNVGEIKDGGKGVPFKMLLWALYCAILIWRLGATPGKMILKIRVVDTVTGEKPAADKAFLRALFSLVSLSAMLLGYAWAIWEKDKRTWHDLIAGTKVVKA